MTLAFIYFNMLRYSLYSLITSESEIRFSE
uniref:Uncharacterized protein n=1 Tax=virus sp. ctML55 TaxID=2827627 RepID=A0A8S5RIH3_9VIRU|nr:MAG TPA: hypothetical protein [virus sp. ctML55]